MIKFILPAIIVFLIVLLWDKIHEFVLNRFNVKLNYLLITVILLIVIAIILLLNL
jgi:hypothetical protein